MDSQGIPLQAKGPGHPLDSARCCLSQAVIPVYRFISDKWTWQLEVPLIGNTSNHLHMGVSIHDIHGGSQ